MERTTTVPRTVTMSIPRRATRIHPSMTIPLSRTRSSTSTKDNSPDARSTLTSTPFRSATTYSVQFGGRSTALISQALTAVVGKRQRRFGTTALDRSGKNHDDLCPSQRGSSHVGYTSGRRVDVLRPELRFDHGDARVISRLTPQTEQTPYSLINKPARTDFVAARYAVDGSIPSARARH